MRVNQADLQYGERVRKVHGIVLSSYSFLRESRQLDVTLGLLYPHSKIHLSLWMLALLLSLRERERRCRSGH